VYPSETSEFGGTGCRYPSLLAAHVLLSQWGGSLPSRDRPRPAVVNDSRKKRWVSAFATAVKQRQGKHTLGSRSGSGGYDPDPPFPARLRPAAFAAHGQPAATGPSGWRMEGGSDEPWFGTSAGGATETNNKRCRCFFLPRPSSVVRRRKGGLCVAAALRAANGRGWAPALASRSSAVLRFR
jgi:hypothetical protein